MQTRFVSVAFFFFFQAEDGIRDLTVTGVQTLCSSDLDLYKLTARVHEPGVVGLGEVVVVPGNPEDRHDRYRSEEHTSELQSQSNLVCRLLLEKKKNIRTE